MYTPVIGLEIHLQVKANSKMFCRCSTDYFGKSPNINICPVCTGQPGALPIPNKVAFEKAIKLARALNCTVAKKTKFDRKNYYYPDLPKGYQISQYDQPIGEDGYVEIELGDDARRIRITRVHLEEDTAKSIHSEDGETLIDFNKSGIPLIEIVTEPDFQSIDELVAFGKRMRQIVRYAQVSDAEMQKGQMRFELNISLRKDSDPAGRLPNYRIEVKNIGSISVLENVANFEIARQSKLLDAGETIVQQTRGLKDMSGETILQRTKETADDYRYFPEPDIPSITIESSVVEALESELGEMPGERKARYMLLGLQGEQADILVEEKEKGDWFDEYGQLVGWDQEKSLEGVKWVTSEIAGFLEKKKIDILNSPLSQQDVKYLVEMVLQKKITRSVGKKVIEIMFTEGGEAQSIVEERNLLQITNDDAIEEFVQQAIEDNAKVVADIQKNPNAIKFLVGQVMKLSRGKANPQTVEKMLEEKLL